MRVSELTRHDGATTQRPNTADEGTESGVAVCAACLIRRTEGRLAMLYTIDQGDSPNQQASSVLILW
jgi:hypothetical protein